MSDKKQLVQQLRQHYITFIKKRTRNQLCWSHIILNCFLICESIPMFNFFDSLRIKDIFFWCSDIDITGLWSLYDQLRQTSTIKLTVHNTIKRISSSISSLLELSLECTLSSHFNPLVGFPSVSFILRETRVELVHIFPIENQNY